MKKYLLFISILFLLISCNNDGRSGGGSSDTGSFTVSFYSNGQEVSPRQVVDYGQQISEPEIPDTPTADSYFVGWFHDDEQWNFKYGVSKDMKLTARFDLIALKFDCDSSFKVIPRFVPGVNLKYSLDNGKTWQPCADMEEIQVSGTVYFRGTDNTIITEMTFDPSNWKNWKLVPDNGEDGIRCSGNIEALLDYEAVANGNHPTMGEGCFCALFAGCEHLLTSPQLPSPVLSPYCYAFMFMQCTGLKAVPILPEVDSYATYCYLLMFSECNMLRFVTWNPGSYEPFLVTHDGIEGQAFGMFTGGITPSADTSYFYYCLEDN